MSKKRKQYSASFKSKVALAALKGDQTTSEIAALFQIHPTIVSTWKRELLDNAPDLFEGKKKSGKFRPGTVDLQIHFENPFSSYLGACSENWLIPNQECAKRCISCNTCRI